MSVRLYDNFNDPSKYVECNVPFTLSRDTFDRENYVICAWSATPDGKNGKLYELSENYKEDNTSIYAQWMPAIPNYRIPIYGCIQCINEGSFSVNGDSHEFSPIVINGDNKLFRDIYGQVVPFKYSTVDTNKGINKNTVFNNNNDDAWKDCFNARYHIYDGDLPYIDIQLLCKSNDYTLPTNMIPYDSISVNKDSGDIGITGKGDNSVAANKLSTALNNLIDYLKTNSSKGDRNFWTQSVPVTT